KSTPVRSASRPTTHRRRIACSGARSAERRRNAEVEGMLLATQRVLAVGSVARSVAAMRTAMGAVATLARAPAQALYCQEGPLGRHATPTLQTLQIQAAKLVFVFRWQTTLQFARACAT